MPRGRPTNITKSSQIEGISSKEEPKVIQITTEQLINYKLDVMITKLDEIITMIKENIEDENEEDKE